MASNHSIPADMKSGNDCDS